MSLFRFSRSTHPAEAELSAYIDGELKVRRARVVDAHLDACDDCRAVLEGLRDARAALAALPRETPSRSFVLSPAMAAERLAAMPPSRPRFAMFVPAMALTLLVSLLAVDQLAVSNNQTSTQPTHEASFKNAAAAATDSAQSAAPVVPGPAAPVAPPTSSDANRQSSTFAAPAVPPVAGAPAQPPSAAAGGARPGPTPPTLSAATQPPPPPVATHSSTHMWLHWLEVLAAFVFVLSALVVYGPGLRRRLSHRNL